VRFGRAGKESLRGLVAWVRFVGYGSWGGCGTSTRRLGSSGTTSAFMAPSGQRRVPNKLGTGRVTWNGQLLTVL
jgi:hypothetical protein